MNFDSNQLRSFLKNIKDVAAPQELTDTLRKELVSKGLAEGVYKDMQDRDFLFCEVVEGEVIEGDEDLPRYFKFVGNPRQSESEFILDELDWHVGDPVGDYEGCNGYYDIGDLAEDLLEEICFVSLPKKRPGRNSPCPCQSGKKFKKCCAYN